MTKTISELFDALPDEPARFLHRVQAEQIALFQDPRFFDFAHGQAARRAMLQQAFAAVDRPPIHLGHALRHLVPPPAFGAARRLPDDFFDPGPPDRLAARAAALDGGIVVLNNNDVRHYAAYAAIRAAARAIFLVWDFDNHHSENNLGLSATAFLAAHADLYAPAHPDNFFILSRLNAAIARPLPCACVQWSRAFVGDRLDRILSAPRSDVPLGRHIGYGRFALRLGTLQRLSRHFPDDVAAVGLDYHQLSAEDRFEAWRGRKLHWIVPTLADVPVRLFDAMITGGLPILPEFMRLSAPLADLPADMAVFHGPDDIDDPAPLVARALAQFDRAGPAGIAARHVYAYERHHGDARLALLLDHARAVFDLRPGAAS